MLFFLPRGVLDEILNLIESVSEGFPSYFFINDKRDDFDFDTVNFPFLDGDVPRSSSYSAGNGQWPGGQMCLIFVWGHQISPNSGL